MTPISFPRQSLINFKGYSYFSHRPRCKYPDGLLTDSFVKRHSSFDIPLNRFEQFLCKNKKLTIRDYRKNREVESETTNPDLKEHIDKKAQSTIVLSRLLKEDFDERYGENNYVFVSVGTSPAMVGKAFECMGVETRYMPISSLTGLRNAKDLGEDFIQKYKKFLEEQKIIGRKDNKTRIFVDYTATGRSLEVIRDLIRNEYGEETKYTNFISLNKRLFEIAEEHQKPMVAKFVYEELENMMAKNYTTIGHLEAQSVRKELPTAEEMCCYHCLTAKLFDFCLMKRLDEMGLLVENPANRISL